MGANQWIQYFSENTLSNKNAPINRKIFASTEVGSRKKKKIRLRRPQNCRVYVFCSAIADNGAQDESDDRLWLQSWWQQLHPGTCSWSWLAADTSSLDCLWDINTCSKCCLSALNSPKVSCVHHQCLNASGSAGLQSCLGSSFPWVIRKGCQGAGREGWVGWGGWLSYQASLTSGLRYDRHHPCSHFTLTIKGAVKSLHRDAALLKDNRYWKSAAVTEGGS